MNEDRIRQAEMSKQSVSPRWLFYVLAVLNAAFATAFFIERDGRRRAENELYCQSVELLSVERRRDNAIEAANTCIEAKLKERQLNKYMDELRFPTLRGSGKKKLAVIRA